MIAWNVVPFHGIEAECAAILAGIICVSVVVGHTWHPVVVSNLPVVGPLPVYNVVYVSRLIQANPQFPTLHFSTFANQLDIVFILLGGDYGEFCFKILTSVLRIFPVFPRGRNQILLSTFRNDGGDDGVSHGIALLVGRIEVHVEDRLLGCL